MVEVHEQVAGLVRGPVPGRVGGDAEDVDAAGGHGGTNSTYNRRSVTVSMWKKSAANNPDV
jgi:hypothetical protein